MPDDHHLRVRYRSATGRGRISVTQALQLAGRIDAQWFTDESAERGRAVHALTEQFDRRDPLSVPPPLSGYLDGYAQFTSTLRPAWHAIEAEVHDDALDLAGRVDRVGTLLGADAILDIKTSPPYPWHGQQLALYARILGRPVSRWGLYLTRDGRYRLLRYTDPRDFTLALHAVALAQGCVTEHGDVWRRETRHG